MTMQEILGKQISYEEALERIKGNSDAYEMFCDLSEEHQQEIIQFMQGIRGLPILYDEFYKYVFDPELHPERLESLLSELFGQPVVIQEVLAKEGNRLVEEGSLVVMDIVIRLSDGSIVDVEMQKHGYLFTGERSSCYLADMIMRQYNRIKKEKKKKFKFSYMKPVYLVVLLERSTEEFKKVAPAYIHRLENKFDSDVKLNVLDNLTYISLDTFGNVRENISNKLDAWLTFLSSDKPEDIMKLVEAYPEFKECYQDIAEFRKKPEELMYKFSDALIQMDKNTVQYMIEEQQKELEEQQKELEEQQKELEEQQKELEEQQKELEEQQKELQEKDSIIEKQAARLAELEAQLASQL